MNSRLRLRPPKQTLAQRSGSAIKPIGLPSGLNTLTPSRSALPMPRAAPQIAVDVDPKAVRRFLFFAVDKHAAIGELRSAVVHSARAPRPYPIGPPYVFAMN